MKRTYSRFSIPQEGKSALHLAAASGHSEAVAALTLNGADVSAQDFVSTTKFHKTRIKMIYPLKIDLFEYYLNKINCNTFVFNDILNTHINLSEGTVLDTDIKRIKITDVTKFGNAFKTILFLLCMNSQDKFQ